MLPSFDQAISFLSTPSHDKGGAVWLLSVEDLVFLEQLQSAFKAAGAKKTVVAVVSEHLLLRFTGHPTSGPLSNSMTPLSQGPTTRMLHDWVAASFPLRGVVPSQHLPGLLALCAPNRTPICIALTARFTPPSVQFAAAAVERNKVIYAAECTAVAVALSK